MIDQKYSCTSELGAEILMVITSLFTTAVVLRMAVKEIKDKGRVIRLKTANDHDKNMAIFLSSAYTLLLPLLSYFFAQAKQYYPEGRARVILTWMVLIENIQVRNDYNLTWELQKSAEQLVRLLWISFLVYAYMPIDELKIALLLMCVLSAVYEILKGVYFNKAKSSPRIGKNPKIIHNHVKQIMFQDNRQTMPMNVCDYIVMGEENHKIAVCDSGYIIGDKKSNSIFGMLTIGRVFQLSSTEDEAFTLAIPNWRDTCLSLGLAKMLWRRFAKLTLDEAGSIKAMNFVLEGLIGYIGTNMDIQRSEGSTRERNPKKRVFSIIEDELKFVSEFLHTKVPIYHYFRWYRVINDTVLLGATGTILYFMYNIFKKDLGSSWISHVAEGAYNHCFFKMFSHGSTVLKVFSYLDHAITLLLIIACFLIQGNGWNLTDYRWDKLWHIAQYFENPAKYVKDHKSFVLNVTVREARVYTPVYYATVSNVFGTKFHVSTCAHLLHWLTKRIPSAAQNVFRSTNAKEAILKSLKDCGGRLTNGETSLIRHGMEYLCWACLPNQSNTEAILLWHIATTIFYHKMPPHQENQDPHNKVVEVALSLSSYCHYLVASLPGILQEEVEWIKETYENVRKEISTIDWSSGQMFPSANTRCNYALQTTWDEKTVVGKGVKLAKDLVKSTESKEAVDVWNVRIPVFKQQIAFTENMRKRMDKSLWCKKIRQHLF